MPMPPSLPPVIGATENALRALLLRVLSPTPVRNYEQWVYLNAASTSQDAMQAMAKVSDVLKRTSPAVATLRDRLSDTGLLNGDGGLSATGERVLRDARGRVQEATTALVAGIEPAELAASIHVLTVIRNRAEAMLSEMPDTGSDDGSN
jgi:hypothetical protein